MKPIQKFSRLFFIILSLLGFTYSFGITLSFPLLSLPIKLHILALG